MIKDSLPLEFRSCALTKNGFFALSISNPAVLFKISTDFLSYKEVYFEQNEGVFYDCMQFIDDKNGLAIGDPIDGKATLITTHDGGETWQKTANNITLEKGEAFFAASNTNLVVHKNTIWVTSGGSKARIFKSIDKGLTWQNFETPIAQNETMTGIYTAAFYDSKTGFVSGGDYDKPYQNFKNKAVTADGGISWKLVSENAGFGYASCLQYVPKSRGKKLICVGKLGVFYSANSGRNWNQIATDPELYTLRFLNKNCAIAAGKNKIIRLKLN